MARASSRFMKKVPPSGGPPAFKLTLPHQIVHRHLLHLVDADFDLAPSPSAQQTWQGSISPRRNKERSEYTLQGWKLFAEAHQVKAGDQISFELVSPHRMVVQIMKTVDTAGTPDVLPSPAKTLKLEEHSSPARSCEYKQESCEQLLQEPSSLLYSSRGMLTDGCMAPYEDWPFINPAQPSSASEDGSSQISGRRVKSMSNHLDEASMMPKSESMPPQSPAAVNASPQEQVSTAVPSPNQRSSLGPTSDDLLSAAPLASSASTLFQDYLTGSLQDPATEDLEPLAMPKDFFDTEHAEHKGGAAVLAANSQLDMHLGNLTNTTVKLQADVHRFEFRANEAENEIGNIRGFYSKLQDALDRQTRGALRAATNLEKTTNQLAAPHLLSNVGSQSQEALLSIQSDLLTCLSALKGSLWQLLVLSVDECAASPP